MARRRFRIFGKWSIPAWVLVGLALFFLIVDLFQRADWLISIRKSPAFQAVVSWASRPLGFVLIFAGGLLWLTILAFSGVDSDEEGRRVESEPAPERIPDERPAVAPSKPSIAETALDAEPNIIVVETSIRHVNLSGAKLVEDPNGGAVAAVVCFRNDAVRGRQVGEMETTKAHLRFQSFGKTVLNIDAGCWLEEEHNFATLSPGDTRTLVIGIRKVEDGPDVIATSVPDDRRDSSDNWLDLRWKVLPTQIAGIHVKLVGGWPKVHVREFWFVLTTAPEFKIMGPMNQPEADEKSSRA